MNMKIFIIGLPRSGRSTVANAIAEEQGYHYIDAVSWVRSTFRDPKEQEHPNQYEDEYQQYLTNRMVINPWFVSDRIQDMMNDSGDTIFVIDGISSPKDFTALFDYRQDIVVFLNRTDNEHEYRDHENIGTSVIRDYCFWMTSAGLITKHRWLEYNFKIPGEDSEHVKTMGAQNSVFIVRSIGKAIMHLREQIKGIVQPSSLSSSS
jgi:hypothetical protein